MSGGPGDVKICASCGRAMTWRKAWAKNWADVRYCSSACRSRKLKAADHDLEAAILAHFGEADAVRSNYEALAPAQQEALRLFLEDL